MTTLERIRPTYTRRDVLKLMVAAGAAASTPEIAFQAHSFISRITRQERPTLIEPEPHSVFYGYSPDHNNLSYIERIGIQPQVLNFFVGGYGIDSDHIFEQIYQCSHLGIVPMISWGVFNDVYNQKFHQHGNFDHLMAKLKAIDGRFILRPFYENNMWLAESWWGETNSKRFVEGWRYLYDILGDNNVNCAMLYAVNTTTNKLNTFFFEDRFPGDDYLHLVGLDSYNKHKSDLFDIEHINPNPTPEEELGHDIAVLQRLSSAPLIISEINEYGDGDWTVNTIEYAVRAGAIGVMTFDWNKQGNEIDWRISDRPIFKRKIIELMDRDFWLGNHPDYKRFQLAV